MYWNFYLHKVYTRKTNVNFFFFSFMKQKKVNNRIFTLYHIKGIYIHTSVEVYIKFHDSSTYTSFLWASINIGVIVVGVGLEALSGFLILYISKRDKNCGARPQGSFISVECQESIWYVHKKKIKKKKRKPIDVI